MQFLKLFLAVFRLTVFVRYDDFPPMKWIRDEWAIFSPFWRELFACHRCVGVHASWILFVLSKIKWTRWIVDILALAGAEMLVHDLVWKKKK